MISYLSETPTRVAYRVKWAIYTESLHPLEIVLYWTKSIASLSMCLPAASVWGFPLLCRAMSLDIVSHQCRFRTRSHVALNARRSPEAEKERRCTLETLTIVRYSGQPSHHETYCVYARDVKRKIDIVLPHWSKNKLAGCRRSPIGSATLLRFSEN